MILRDYKMEALEADMSGNGHKTSLEECISYKNILDIPLDMISSSEIMGNGI